MVLLGQNICLCAKFVILSLSVLALSSQNRSNNKYCMILAPGYGWPCLFSFYGPMSKVRHRPNLYTHITYRVKCRKFWHFKHFKEVKRIDRINMMQLNDFHFSLFINVKKSIDNVNHIFDN